MSDVPGQLSSAPPGLKGIYRSWLHAESRDLGLSSPCSPGTRTRQTPHLFGSARVLVADDNPVNLLVISAMLESRGLLPLLAADGAEAVALACELQFDLILMDLQMPLLDGLGATGAIRRFEAAHARAAVPVLAYSSACPGPAVLASHGLNGSLDKPCSGLELEECLSLWCPTFRPDPTASAMAQANGRAATAGHPSGARSSAPR